jgi:hypothetical protein
VSKRWLILSALAAACAVACDLSPAGLGAGGPSEDASAFDAPAGGGWDAYVGDAPGTDSAASSDSGNGGAGGGGGAGGAGGGAGGLDGSSDAEDAGSDASTPHTITFVQAVVASYVTTSSVSTSITLTGGDLLVVALFWGGGQTPNVTDTLGNTWQSAPPSTVSGCSSQGQIWYAENVKGGADSVTATANNGNPLGFIALEYSGVLGSGSLDSQANQSASSDTNAMTPGALNTTAALDVLVAAFSDLNGTGTMVTGTGFASRGGDQLYYSLAEDDLPGVAPGTYSPAAQLPGGNADACWTAVGAAFKAK